MSLASIAPSWPRTEPIPPSVPAAGRVPPSDAAVPASAGYLSRKSLPIKKNDSEPLTRSDVQYDLLDYIFSDTRAVFTPAIPGSTSKITFSDLYVQAIYNSSKCSKVIKDKMSSTPQFGIELAKISLLTNVGRINTTMAFFHEMKTALRTYHPVPCLQKTDGNAQDAPRIKNCLRAVALSSEVKNAAPSTTEEILEKLKDGVRPPTTVVNLIFVLSTHATVLGAKHFEDNLNILDLFLPKDLCSKDRARAFLWHIYHYLEDPSSNPFNDDFSRRHPDKAPLIRRLTPAERAKENVDPPEELEQGIKMTNQRNLFLHRLIESMRNSRRSNAPHFIPATSDAPHPTSFRARGWGGSEPSSKEPVPFMYYVPGSADEPAGRLSRPSTQIEPLSQTQMTPKSNAVSHTYCPRSKKSPEQRSMLQQAWHTMLNSDPLCDSDEESADENLRLDYARRLDVISNIRRIPFSPKDQGGRGSKDADRRRAPLASSTRR